MDVCDLLHNLLRNWALLVLLSGLGEDQELDFVRRAALQLDLEPLVGPFHLLDLDLRLPLFLLLLRAHLLREHLARVLRALLQELGVLGVLGVDAGARLEAQADLLLEG